MKRYSHKLLIDYIVLVSSLVVFATGLILLFGFHVGVGSWRTEAFGINRLTWLNLHRLTALLLAASMIAHLAVHFRLLMVRLKRPIRWKAETALVVTFFVVVLTGCAAWLFIGGSAALSGPVIIGPLPIYRHIWVDLHNFSGLAVLPLVVFHTVRRWSRMKHKQRFPRTHFSSDRAYRKS